MDSQTPLVRECPNTPPSNKIVQADKKVYEKNRKRKVQVILRLSESEHDQLCEWAAACRKSKSDYLRMLLQGFQPVEFPPLEYREVIDELRRIGVNMNQIASKAHSLGFIDAPEYEQNEKRVRKAIADFSEVLTRGGVKFGSNKNMGGKA